LSSDFDTFQNYKHQRACITNLQWSKKLANPMTLTEYSLRPPNHQFKSEIQHFSGEDTDKNTAKMHQNTPFDVKNSFFFW